MRATVQKDSITVSPAREGQIDQEKVPKGKITTNTDQYRLTPKDIVKMINDTEKLTNKGTKLKNANLEDAKLKGPVKADNELESPAYDLNDEMANKEKQGSKPSTEESARIEEITTKKITGLKSKNNVGKAKESLEEL